MHVNKISQTYFILYYCFINEREIYMKILRNTMLSHYHVFSGSKKKILSVFMFIMWKVCTRNSSLHQILQILIQQYKYNITLVVTSILLNRKLHHWYNVTLRLWNVEKCISI